MRGGDTGLVESDDYDSESEEEEEEGIDAYEEDASSEESEDNLNDGARSKPVQHIQLKLSTSLLSSLSSHQSSILDQSIELPASSSRTISSLKQSISRQFKSRPPEQIIQLRYDGQVLEDDITLEDLVEDEDDNDDEDDGSPKVSLLVDIIPPVDPKFATEWKQRTESMKNEELLDVYAANQAAIQQNMMELISIQEQQKNLLENTANDEDEDVPDSFTQSKGLSTIMRQASSDIKEQIINSMSKETKERFNEETNDNIYTRESLSSGDIFLKQSIKNRLRKRGGASINVRRAMQKNLNINWADTIRNFFLFLFFGYFGGRNSLSRTIMFLGAPTCFFVQLRPVKVGIKQLFYAIGEPHGILLSLFPAPQQAIMSCNYDEKMMDLYGSDVGLYNDLIFDHEGNDKNELPNEEQSESDSYEELYDEYDSDY